MAVIDQSVVRILPDFRGFKSALRTGLKQATVGINGTVKVKLVADATGLAASIRKAVAEKNLPAIKVKVEVDQRSLRAVASQVAAAGRGGLRGRSGLFPAAGDVQREGQQMLAAQSSANRSAERELLRSARLRKQLWKDLEPPTIIDWGGSGIKPMHLLYGAAVALSPVLVAVGASAIQAGTSVVAMGSAMYGGALAVTGLVTAFSGVLGALKLHSGLQKTLQGQTARTAATVQHATDARKAEKKSLTDLAQAYRDAAQKVKDLRLQLEDLRVQQSGNALDTEEAVRKQREVNSNFFATDLMKRQAAQAVKETKQRGKDIAAEIDKTNRELAGRRTLRNAPEVQRAKDAVSSARAGRIAAENLAPPAASGQLDAALKDLSPAARELYTWVVANTEQFKQYRRAMEQAVLPGFLTFLKQITTRTKGASSTLDVFVDGVTAVGREISTTVADLGKIAGSKWFRGQLAALNKDNATAFKLVGKAVVTSVRPIMQLLVKASPLIVRFAAYLQRVAVKFSDWVNAKDKSGELAAWFKKAGDELAKWWRIAGNLGSILLSVFKASLPTGNDLTSRLETFTSTLAKWAKGDEGQRKIKSFFEFFKNIDYAKLGQFVVNLAKVYALVKAGKFTAQHPIFTLFTVLAAKYPKETSEFVDSLATAVGNLLTFVNNNGTAVGGLLAIAGAYQVFAAVSKIKSLPGIGKLLETGPLGKLFGGRGESIKNPLYVWVVNGGGGGGDDGDTTVANGGGKDKNGKPKPKSKPKKIANKLKGGVKGGAVAIGGALLVDPLIDLAFGDTKKGTPKDAVKGTLSGAAQGAMAGSMFGPWGAVAGGLIGAAVGGNTGIDPMRPQGTRVANDAALITKRNAAIKNEALAFKTLGKSAAITGNKLAGAGEAEFATAKAMADHNDQLQSYILTRRKSVQAQYDYIRATKGTAAAEVFLLKANQDSREALSQTLQRFGWTKTAAEKYATSVKDIPPAKATKVTTPGLPEARVGFADLKTNVNASTGQKTITLTMADGSTTVFRSLREAMTYQRALQSGLTLESAAQAIKRDEEATRNRLYGHAATGGHIRGPGTATSDSIPTLLSDGEFVHKTAAVQKYGTRFMYDVNEGRFPKELAARYASGGMVKWPFPVDVSKTQVPQSPLAGAGTVSGDQGVSETAERVARKMGASEKQLIALIEAGLVESGLRNLSYGDRDSVGFLQQRAGWGTVRQRMDVGYATRKFIEKARRVDRAQLDAGQLAQAVQVSATPTAYGKRYADALAVLNQLPPYVAGGGLGLLAGGRGWQWQEQILRQKFGKAVQFFSTTGGKHAKNSWHYRGRALDLTPSMEIFNWIKSSYGANTQELIYGPAGVGIRHGAPYNFGPKLNAQHMNHIHWAYAKGGAVKAQKFDTGGVLQPGVTLAVNNTRKPETIRTHEQEQALQNRFARIDRRDLALLAAYIANAIAGQAIQMDGRKVAETVRGYDYLPRGI